MKRRHGKPFGRLLPSPTSAGLFQSSWLDWNFTPAGTVPGTSADAGPQIWFDLVDDAPSERFEALAPSLLNAAVLPFAMAPSAVFASVLFEAPRYFETP